MSLLRLTLLIGSIMAASPAYAIDPLFTNPETKDLVRTAFLKSERGASIVRQVVGLAAKTELNEGHYYSFLAILEYSQNVELYQAVEDRVFVILEKVGNYQPAGAAPTHPAAQAVARREYEKFVIKTADETLSPPLEDLATIAQDLPIKQVSPQIVRTIRQDEQDLSRPKNAEPGDRVQFTQVKDSPTAGISFSNTRLKQKLRTRFRVIRDLSVLIYQWLFGPKDGALPAPKGMTPEQTREYRRNFINNSRRFVRSMGGFNEWSRRERILELMAQVDRSAYAQLTVLSEEVLRRYEWGGLSIDALLAEQKKIAEANKLNIPEVVWEGQRRILYTISDVKEFCGTGPGDESASAILKVANNVKTFQARAVKAETEAAELTVKLRELERTTPNDDVALRVTRQALTAKEQVVLSLNKEAFREIDILASLYAQVEQARPLVTLSNRLREGKLGAKQVGALDMHRVFVVPKEVLAHWDKFERDSWQSEISDRVMPKTWRTELRPLSSRWLGAESTKKFAGLMNRYHQELTGRTLESSSFMTDLAKHVDVMDARIKTASKIAGVVGAAGAFTPVLIHYAGVCWQALAPHLPLLGK